MRAPPGPDRDRIASHRSPSIAVELLPLHLMDLGQRGEDRQCLRANARPDHRRRFNRFSNFLRSDGRGGFFSAHSIARSSVILTPGSWSHNSFSGRMRAVLTSHTPASISSTVTVRPACCLPNEICPRASIVFICTPGTLRRAPHSRALCSRTSQLSSALRFLHAWSLTGLF